MNKRRHTFRVGCLLAASLIFWGAIPTMAAARARPLGEMSVRPDSVCPTSRCLSFEVRTRQLAASRRGQLAISEPSGPPRGTIVIFSGAGGTSLWGVSEKPDLQRRYDETLGAWTRAGFRVVRVRWERDWVSGDSVKEGLAALGVLPATVVKWVSDNLTNRGTPLCIGGNSGGAAQATYPLTHYGLANRVSLSVAWAGFWMGRIDLGCLSRDSQRSLLRYNAMARRMIDRSVGVGPDDWLSEPVGDAPRGPCAMEDPRYRQALERASISVGGVYRYPRTMVWLVLGGADEVGALGQALTYFEQLSRARSPHVRLDVLPGVGHGVDGTEEGLGRVREAFLEECRAQSPR